MLHKLNIRKNKNKYNETNCTQHKKITINKNKTCT